MPSKKDSVLEFNHYMKSNKMPYIIYTDMKSLIRNIDGPANNTENYSTIKIGKHISCEYSMAKIQVFDLIESKHTLYRRNDSIKKVCESLREHTKNIIYFEKKKKVIIDKGTNKMKSKCKKLLHLWKKNL